MISFADFKKEDGSVDWPRYQEARAVEHKAEIDAGKYCYKCDRYILFPKGHRERCPACVALADPAECDHPKFVRCPKCGRSFEPAALDSYELYEAGEHKVTCGDCDHQFEVSTRVSYTFTSPAKLAPEAPTEPEE